MRLLISQTTNPSATTTAMSSRPIQSRKYRRSTARVPQSSSTSANTSRAPLRDLPEVHSNQHEGRKLRLKFEEECIFQKEGRSKQTRRNDTWQNNSNKRSHTLGLPAA
mmetsp:Transcript_27040/g.57378  ORF Transcript_27040/g.57378 Transcript_27040/m.57378 type:complete len:108 (-) Transcript_27040:85-408(-)